MTSGVNRCPASGEQFRELHTQQPRSASTAEMYREMAEGTYDYSKIALDHVMPRDEAQKLWDDEGKAVRYTLMRILSKPIIEETCEKFDTLPAAFVLEMADQRDMKDPTDEALEMMKYVMRLTLYRQIDEKLDRFEELLLYHNANPLAQAYGKHLEWIEFYNDNLLEDGTAPKGLLLEPRGTIGSGMKTGTEMMAGLIKVLPALLYEAKGKKISVQECLTTAHNSESLLNSLAILDIPTFKRVAQSFKQTEEQDPFDVLDNFALTEDEKGYKVELTHATIDTALGAIALTECQEEITATRRVRCPGLLNGGIKTLWQWHLDNAQILWEEGLLHPDLVTNSKAE